MIPPSAILGRSWLYILRRPACRESATRVQQLTRTACLRHHIVPGQQTTQSNRGSIQVAKSVTDLYHDLGIVRSLSRPRDSNVNAFSKSQFKTTKYALDYPVRFDSFDHAEAWCDTVLSRCATEHLHSGIAFLTPAIVHDCDRFAVAAQRQATMDRA